MSLSSGPLSSFVLDLTRARAGPTAARMLADWGMQTIKIEQPAELSVPLGGPRDGFDFQNLHRNKRSMTLNLKRRGWPRNFLNWQSRRMYLLRITGLMLNIVWALIMKL